MKASFVIGVPPHRYQAKVLCYPKKNNFLHFYSGDVDFTIFGIFIFTSLMDMWGKIAKLIYTILKNRQPYDSIIHAKACGIPWEDIYNSKIQNIDSDSYLVKAMELNGEEIEKTED